MKPSNRGQLTVVIALLGFLTACSAGISTPGNGLVITIQTDPATPQIGTGQILINVLDANNHALDGADVEVSFGMANMNMGQTQDGPAAGQGQGRYTRPVTFHQKGDYLVHVWVNQNGRTLQTQDFSFSIK